MNINCVPPTNLTLDKWAGNLNKEGNYRGNNVNTEYQDYI